MAACKRLLRLVQLLQRHQRNAVIDGRLRQLRILLERLGKRRPAARSVNCWPICATPRLLAAPPRHQSAPGGLRAGRASFAGVRLDVEEIERDGFPIQARIECLLSSDTDTGMAKTIGIAILGLADALTAWRPDMLLLIADRYEMLAPAPWRWRCAFPSRTSKAAKSRRAPSTTRCATRSPSWRTSTSRRRPDSARRVIAMGEEPERVHHAGAPSLDHLRRSALLDRAQRSKPGSASSFASPDDPRRLAPGHHP
jgi:hypothetical protein